MDKKQATKTEVLLAVAMSGYYQTTHVHYLPPGTRYISMLRLLRSQKYIEPIGENFYKLTDKGRDYILRQDITDFKEVDSQIDEFINKL